MSDSTKVSKTTYQVSDPSPLLPQLYPDISTWPIYRLLERREEFVREINEHTLEKYQHRKVAELDDVIAKTVYMERIRINEEPWKVDPPKERQFWRKVQSRLVEEVLDKPESEAKEATLAILWKIVNRYSEEIVGTFKISTFQFARKFLTLFFSRLLNAAKGKNLTGRFFGSRRSLTEHLKVVGDMDTIRALFDKGTVVVVPTHFSNIDSIMVGYVMDAILGLPSFSYGAGLNLYNTGYTAYFMNRLGAYRVDRRKKNNIYLDTLKAMSTLSLVKGVNTLFFPGGTRSRAGNIEDKLKMGLLGTTIEAQRMLCQAGKSEKIFIVPLVMSYPFVLEARFLIEQHLKQTGKEQYLSSRDQGTSIRSIARFVWELFGKSADITMSFGKPFDVMGNFVNAEGISTDKRGKPVDIKDYFLSDGALQPDYQREEEYTRLLADKIVERFHEENVVLSPHLLAYAVFNILRQQNPGLDLYGVLRLPCEDYFFPLPLVTEVVELMRAKLLTLNTEGKIKLSPELVHLSPEELIRDGVANLGLYHAQKPLFFNKEGTIESADFKVLYYYHNRMEGYQLANGLPWNRLLGTKRNVAPSKDMAQ